MCILLWHLKLHKAFDHTHLQVFLAIPVIQLHFTKPYPSLIDCKQACLMYANVSVLGLGFGQTMKSGQHGLVSRKCWA